MTHNSILVLLVVLWAPLTCIDDEPFKITTNRSEDRIEMGPKDDTAMFIISSPFGISNAIIERANEQWPDKVVIQLQLKGLI